jgi:hypothetical protein
VFIWVSMELKVWALLLALVLVTGGCVPQNDVCHVDNDCRGDRVCNFGTCQDPNLGGSNGSGGTQNPPPIAKTLSIAPIAQQEAKWCWLASAEMIFRHYDIPAANPISYQCGIIALISGPASPCWTNCAVCDFGSGTEQNAALVLSVYPQILQSYSSQPVRQLQSQLTHVRATPQQIMTTIVAEQPLEIGVTPTGPFTGVAGHAIVMIGYDSSDSSTFRVILNDPFPYESAGFPNPFVVAGAVVLQPGQYEMEYSSFAAALQWSVTISVAPR